jgi:SAM-dependent methyltransferase
MDRDELEDRIAEFTQWGYRFEFDNGASTWVPDGRLINRHEQRRRYFFEALLSIYGGSLEGCRVLDLGCSSGFWSLQALQAGADFVLGVDSQPTPLEQAKLVFEAKGVDPSRYRFEQRDVFELDTSERFDVVLCLALMNQLAKPVELFELMSATGAEVLVVETEISRASRSVFALSSSADGRKAMAHRLVLVPSRSAIVELARDFGYQTVPLARNITDYTGLADYRNQRRLAFICSNARPLDSLPVEDPPLGPWWMSPLNPRPALRRLRG